MEKDFDQWNEIKQRLDEQRRGPLFQEREIWWCAVGVNVGYEVFGKGDLFTRPVLILRKCSHYTFWGAPLTSKRKETGNHYPFDFRGRQGAINFEQMRNYDSRRLGERIGKASHSQFTAIRQALKELL